MFDSSPKAFRIYTAILLVVTLTPTLLAFTTNRLVDPLWYGSGNTLFPQNFPFNERFSKANRFLQHAPRYDCLILGSSRVTLLDARRITGFRCFNLSVSNGNMEEFDDLIEFAARNTQLRLIIVGVDGFNFSDHGIPESIPRFVNDGTEPPPVVESYLSLDVLEFSLRAIFQRGQRTRFYDSSFSCDTMPGIRAFDPPENLDPTDPNGGLGRSPTNTVGPFVPARAKKLLALREQYVPSASWVGYVPPLSSHHISHIAAAGNLEGYLDSIWIASMAFDRFYDFSVPSLITSSPVNTYDGSHFFTAVNDLVAETLIGGEAHGALELHQMDHITYRREFERRLHTFMSMNYGGQ